MRTIMNLMNKKREYSLIIILILLLLSKGIYHSYTSKIRFKKNIINIILTEEDNVSDVEIKDIDDFINNLELDKWERDYSHSECKWAAYYFVYLENDKGKQERIDIITPDEGAAYAFAVYNNRVYKFPVKVYEYIIERKQNYANYWFIRA